MIPTFILMAFSVCAVWLKEIKISTWSIPLWIVFLSAAMVSGVINHYVEWIGILWIVIFGLLSYSTNYTAQCRWTNYRLVHVLHFILMGKLPGFHNPDIVTNMQFSAEGVPFTHRLNLDGISVGIILLAVFCNPVRTWNEWALILRKSAPIIAMTLIVMFGVGLWMNYVAVDVKFIPYTLVFLIANFLFTCVMEESFFRGFLQENFSKVLAKWKYAAAFSIGFAALLFGLAHYQGGLLYVALATLAGLFYGYAKYRVKHIEAAILTHFSVNAVHFIGFTYPNF
jgi:membrane protease YdiL (CAAX protease family)